MTAEELRTLLKLVNIDAAVTQVETDSEQTFPGLVLYGDDLTLLGSVVAAYLSQRKPKKEST